MIILEYYKEYQKFQNCKENIFSDRPEEATMFGCKSLSTKRLKSVLLENPYQIELYNRMRGLMKILEQKYGKNTITTYRNWEKMEGKVSDFKNHQRFSLRCLDKGLVLVSLKLKNHIRTQRGKIIIEKAEKQLLNERIKSINYKLEHLDHDRYMYMNELKDTVGEDQEIWKVCLEEIYKRREIRHSRVMERQIKKLNKLVKIWEDQIQGGCSKHQSDCSKEKEEKGLDKVKKWVINLLSVPLTKD